MSDTDPGSPHTTACWTQCRGEEILLQKGIGCGRLCEGVHDPVTPHERASRPPGCVSSACGEARIRRPRCSGMPSASSYILCRRFASPPASCTESLIRRSRRRSYRNLPAARHPVVPAQRRARRTTGQP